MVRIRLRRMGAKKKPFYRIIIADKQSPRDGRFIESIGTYDPNTKPETVQMQHERAAYWLGVGAWERGEKECGDEVGGTDHRRGWMGSEVGCMLGAKVVVSYIAAAGGQGGVTAARSWRTFATIRSSTSSAYPAAVS